MARTATAVVGYLVVLVAVDLSDLGSRLLPWFVETVGRDGTLLSAFVLFVLLRGPVPGLTRAACTETGRAVQTVVRVGFLVVATVTMIAFDGVFPALLPWISSGVGLAIILAVVALAQRARGRSSNTFEMIELPTAGMFTLLLVLSAFGPSSGDPIGLPLRAGLVGAAVVFSVVFLAPRFQSWTATVPAGRWFTLGGAAMAAIAVAVEGAISLTLTISIGLVLLPALVAFAELWVLVQRSADRVPPARYLAGFDDERLEILHRIKGNYRRALVDQRYDSDEPIDENWQVHSLGEGDKMWLQAQHPHARGGEDLPDLDDGEVEIARMSYTDTVHAEVVSLRVRHDETSGQFRLRLIDEYGTDYILPSTSVERPLRSGDVVALFRDAIPSPMEVDSGYRFQSLFHPGLAERSPVDRDALRQLMAAKGWFSIGFAVRTWARRIAVSSARTARATLDFAGWSSGYDVIAWGFAAVAAYRLSVLASGSTAAGWLSVSVAFIALAPVPALITRRLRDIRPERLREDLRWLLLPIAAGSGLLLLGPGAPLGWAIAIPVLLITMTYLMFRPGDVDPIEQLDLKTART